MTSTTIAPRIIAITDEITTCDCCGRDGLRRTVHLELAEGEDVYYGTTCASTAFKSLGTPASIVDHARRLCSCGCGQFANRVTAKGVRFFHLCQAA